MPFTETEIFCLRDRPAYREAAGRWFHEKWGVPLAEYRRSIDACLAGPGPVPQWYLAVQGGPDVPQNPAPRRPPLSTGRSQGARVVVYWGKTLLRKGRFYALWSKTFRTSCVMG